MNNWADGAIDVSVVVSEVLSTLTSGASIFAGIDVRGERVKVVANVGALFRVPQKGEVWKVEGKWRCHELFGLQIHASKCLHVLPRGRLIVRFLAQNIPGIGEKKAGALWNRFGERIFDVLDSGCNDELLLELGRKTTTALLQCWDEKCAEARVVEFLDAHGFDPVLSAKVQRVWGSEAMPLLRQNPYLLLAFASWAEVDRAAAQMGVTQQDPRRLAAAVEATLYERLDDGHTLTDAGTLEDGVRRRLRRREVSDAIETALRDGAIVGSIEQGFQPVGAAALEERIAQRVHAMQSSAIFGKWQIAPDLSLESFFDRVEAELGFTLNDGQRRAAVLPFGAAIAVLCGGAGVGKTTALRAILALAKRAGISVVQMALAGRAARQMANASNHPAITIARFLSETSSGKLTLTPETLIVIDEASMLDLPMFFRILRNIPDRAHVLLVGDDAQLPPLGFGLIFHRFMESKRVRRVELREVHRQAASSGIPSVASDIRRHATPSFVAFQGAHSGVSFIQCEADEIMPTLRRTTLAWRGLDWRILSALKTGPIGVRSVNAAFHTDALSEPGAPLSIGEPVIHLINDYDRGLMNGSLGTIIDRKSEGGLVIDFDNNVQEFSVDEVRRRIDLAYAISVHKAQGSEFDRVAIIVCKSRLLDHSLIYTALTRGVHQAVFIGDLSAFRDAVAAPPLAQRRCVALGV